MSDKDTKNLIIAVLVIAAVLIILGALGFGGYGIMGGFGMGSMSFNWIFNILIIVLIIAGIYWFVKHSNYNKYSNHDGKR